KSEIAPQFVNDRRVKGRSQARAIDRASTESTGHPPRPNAWLLPTTRQSVGPQTGTDKQEVGGIGANFSFYPVRTADQRGRSARLLSERLRFAELFELQLKPTALSWFAQLRYAVSRVGS